MATLDCCSVSNYDEAVITDLNFNVTVDFSQKALHCTVHYRFYVLKQIQWIILDVEGEDILSVQEYDGESLVFSISDQDLRIKLLSQCEPGSIVNVTIKFKTNLQASGLYWLNPDLTDDGVFPMLISHCWETHCRSIFPCQDTPGVKFKFSAEVSVPRGYNVVMSALRVESPPSDCQSSETELEVFRFRQRRRVAAWSFALVCARMDGRRLGARSILWAHPDCLAMAVFLLSKFEEMLLLAERVCGLNPWGEIAVVATPSAFPFSAMAHPNCIYVPSSHLDMASDRGVARALAQSWLSAAVSPARWQSWWLAEGLVTFVTRRIIARIHGSGRFHLLTALGLDDLRREVGELMMEGPQAEQLTKLEHKNQMYKFQSNASRFQPCHHKNDMVTRVLGEKGHLFFTYLEQLVGGPAFFEPYIKAYVKKYKFNTVTTKQFIQLFIKYFASDTEVQNIDWDQWLFSTGLPWKFPKVDSQPASSAVELAYRWVVWNVRSPPPPLADLSTPQLLVFLSRLTCACPPLPLGKVRAIARLWGTNQLMDPQLNLRWLLLCVQVKCPEQFDECLQFLHNNHQHIYIQPLIKKLTGWVEHKEEIVQYFESNKHKMLKATQQIYEKELYVMLKH